MNIPDGQQQLTPARVIEPPAWMTGARAAAVMAALGGTAAPPQVLFVGGCVRDHLLGLPVAEIDMATVHPPAQTMRLLDAAGIKAIPTGLDHGTVTAVVDGIGFEITTLRRDVSTDGRRATVAFTDDWLQDARRRDFTINTLLADAGGQIYDPTGLGMDDLDAGRVVFVGDPAARIAEDYLRILRFFRFHARFGRGDADPAALEACRAGAHGLAALSRERVTSEMLKLLAAENAAQVLALMFGHGVLADLVAPGFDAAALGRLIALQAAHDCRDPAARLAVLMIPADRTADILILPNDLKRQAAAILAGLAALVAGAGDAPDRLARRLSYLFGADAAAQARLLHAALEDRSPFTGVALDWAAPALPVDGDDVIAAGTPAGPAVGRALKRIESWWLDHDMTPDRAACLEKLNDS